MKYQLFFISIFTLKINIIAQTTTFEWAKQIGSTLYEDAFSVKTDASGNVYVTGGFEGTVDFDPGLGTYNLTSAGSWDIFVTKLDASGNLIWAKRMGGSAVAYEEGFSIAIDTSENVYTTGRFKGPSDFDPGLGTYNLSGEGIFISKLDASGNFVWAKEVSSESAIGNSITLDASENVYITGFFGFPADFDPGPGIYTLVPIPGMECMFISKLDASGNFIWVKKIETGGVIQSIAVDVSGVYTTGNFTITTDFDPGPGVYNLISSGMFISKLDTSGNFIWAKQINNAGGESIAIDASGVYTAGAFVGTVDFDPGLGVYNLISGSHSFIFVSKLDTSGNFIWAKCMGGDNSSEALDLTVDLERSVYTTGYFYGTTDFDPGTGIYNLTVAGNMDVFISKLDSAGNFVWTKQFGGTTHEISNSITIDISGNIYTTGNFNGTSDFDPDLGTYNLTSVGFNDVFVHKIGQCIPPAAPVNTTVSNNLSVCSGNATVLNANGLGSLGWYTAATGGTYIAGGGTYTTSALITNTNYYVQDSTCQANATRTAISVTVNSLPTILSSVDASVCSGSQANFSAFGTNSYSWMGGTVPATGSTVKYFASTGGIYNFTVTGTDGIGCQNKDVMSLTVWAVPTISAISDVSSICGNQIANFSALGSNGSYLWAPSLGLNPSTGTNVLFTPYGSTGMHTFSVSVTDNNGCVGYDTVDLNVLTSIMVTAGNDITICSGNTVSFTATGANNFVWEGYVNGSVYSLPVGGITTAATYSVVGISGTCSDTAFVSVDLYSLPTIAALSDVTICQGDIASFTAVANPAAGISFLWSSGEIINLISKFPISTTSYSVTGTDSHGCSNSAVVSATVNALPDISIGPDITIFTGQTVNLFASNATYCLWSTHETTDTISIAPTTNTTYSVIGTDLKGCSNSDTITIHIRVICDEPFVPNAFSPNNDGENDVLQVKTGNCSYTDFSLQIFNRWGNIIFESHDITRGWDGKSKNGKDVDNGVFVYIVSASDWNGTKYLLKGNSSLIR